MTHPASYSDKWRNCFAMLFVGFCVCSAGQRFNSHRLSRQKCEDLGFGLRRLSSLYVCTWRQVIKHCCSYNDALLAQSVLHHITCMLFSYIVIESYDTGWWQVQWFQCSVRCHLPTVLTSLQRLWAVVAGWHQPRWSLFVIHCSFPVVFPL